MLQLCRQLLLEEGRDMEGCWRREQILLGQLGSRPLLRVASLTCVSLQLSSNIVQVGCVFCPDKGPESAALK